MSGPIHPLRKRCLFCRCEFRPNPRVGERQSSCGRGNCQKNRKKLAQKRWLKENPQYFHSRYENTKLWRKQHPEYQKQWRAKRRVRAGSEIQDEIQDEIMVKTPVKSFSLTFPFKMFQGEIQDEILLKRESNHSGWVAQVS